MVCSQDWNRPAGGWRKVLCCLATLFYLPVYPCLLPSYRSLSSESPSSLRRSFTDRSRAERGGIRGTSRAGETATALGIRRNGRLAQLDPVPSKRASCLPCRLTLRKRQGRGYAMKSLWGPLDNSFIFGKNKRPRGNGMGWGGLGRGGSIHIEQALRKDCIYRH